MKGRLILDIKSALEDGRVIQRRVWQLPQSTPDRPYGIKFSLYCGKDGKTIVRYDNESRKGAHRHIGPDEAESAYDFVSLVRLLKDFAQDIENFSGEIK